MNTREIFCYASAFGALSGMRGSAAPALLSSHYCKKGGVLRRAGIGWFCSKPAAMVFRTMAAGEVVGDKLPAAPDRIKAPGIIGRAFSGALAGVVLDKAAGGKSTTAAAAIGAGAAVAMTYASFYGRKALAKKVGDRRVAIVEDLIVFGLGAWLTHRLGKTGK